MLPTWIFPLTGEGKLALRISEFFHRIEPNLAPREAKLGEIQLHLRGPLQAAASSSPVKQSASEVSRVKKTEERSDRISQNC